MKKIQYLLPILALLSNLFASDVILVPAIDIMAGQETVSLTVCQNVQNNTFRRSVGYVVSPDGVDFSGYVGQSPFLTPFSVIKTPEAFERPYILVDGHHTLRGTLEVMRQHNLDLTQIQVPVQIDRSYSDLNPSEFWQNLSQDGLVYLGRKQFLPCRDIMDLENNELRAFLDATVVSYGLRKPLVYAHPNYHLWIRVSSGCPESSIPFIEYYMAEALEAAGFAYDPLTPITADLVNQARDILSKSEKAASMKLIDSDGRVLSSGLPIKNEYDAFVGRSRWW